MEIKITKVKQNKKVIGFNADFIELPGSPAIGTGKTKEEAVATLFIRNLNSLNSLNMATLKINDKLYEDYTAKR